VSAHKDEAGRLKMEAENRSRFNREMNDCMKVMRRDHALKSVSSINPDQFGPLPNVAASSQSRETCTAGLSRGLLGQSESYSQEEDANREGQKQIYEGHRRVVRGWLALVRQDEIAMARYVADPIQGRVLAHSTLQELNQGLDALSTAESDWKAAALISQWDEAIIAPMALLHGRRPPPRGVDTSDTFAPEESNLAAVTLALNIGSTGDGQVTAPGTVNLRRMKSFFERFFSHPSLTGQHEAPNQGYVVELRLGERYLVEPVQPGVQAPGSATTCVQMAARMVQVDASYSHVATMLEHHK